jgi:hypothetical protein
LVEEFNEDENYIMIKMRKIKGVEG